MQSISRIVTTPNTPPPARRRERCDARAVLPHPPPVPHGNTRLQRSTPARIIRCAPPTPPGSPQSPQRRLRPGPGPPRTPRHGSRAPARTIWRPPPPPADLPEPLLHRPRWTSRRAPHNRPHNRLEKRNALSPVK